MPPDIDHPFPEVPRLTADDEQSLAALRIAGDASARDTLILANIPFALEKAGHFRGGHHSKHLDDLRSIAIAGLIKAADRYEPGVTSRGKLVRFSTYAAHWIRAALELATTDELATIRIPRWAVDAIAIRRKGKPMPAKFDSPESRECIEQALKILRFQSAWRTGNIAKHVPDDDSWINPIDLVASRNTPDPSRLPEEDEPDPSLVKALARLSVESPMDYRVVCLICPIDGSEAMNYSEAGKVVGRRRDLVSGYYRRGLELLRMYIEEEKATATEYGVMREAC